MLAALAWAAPADAAPDCFGPAPDPQPDTAAWTQRESDNLACSAQGQTDAENSPAFARAAQMMFADGQELALRDDNEWDPDPLRYPPLFWDGTRGHFAHVEFPGTGVPTTDGLDVTRPPGWRNNMIYGQLFAPLGQCVRRSTCPGGVPTHPAPPYPAIVLQPGTLSNANQMTFLGEILAEHGYVVLITSYFNSSSQNINALRAGLDYLLSTPAHPDADGQVAGSNPFSYDIFNPFWYEVDPGRVAVAGHSQGGGSANIVGAADPRVKTLILYDPYVGSATTSKPTLIFTVDYTAGFSGPYTSQPAPQSRNYALYSQIAATGADVMEVALRAATHQDLAQTVAGPGVQDYAQQGSVPSNPDSPTTLPPPRALSGGHAGAPSFAFSRNEQQVTVYYTLAWFDRYLRGLADPTSAASGLRRLIAGRFDDSVDSSSIGTGTYDPAKAKAAGNVLAGNVPIKIDGWSVTDRLSFYYLSHYQLDGGRLRCADMRAGISAGTCPTRLP
jgi:dienelactone hydrolase